MMDNDFLYVELKNTLMRSIYEGTRCCRAADSPSVPFRSLRPQPRNGEENAPAARKSGIIREKTGLWKYVSFERGSHLGKL